VPPDISRYAELLGEVCVAGPQRFIYSYRHEQAGDVVGNFLTELQATEAGRYSSYVAAFQMVGTRGFARNEKHRMLDNDRIPKGIAKTPTGEAESLNGMGEFKNIGHKSRIYHCTMPGGLIVLLTVFTEKKEDALTADAINPALYARREFFRRRDKLLARAQGGGRR
jgi:hypothetical protein